MEPMNASPHHSKVRVTLTLSDPVYVAGDAITGKMEMECRADKGLGLGIISVELLAVQELTSRDHSATSPFIHTRRLFQGPGLPPSNAVLPHPLPGEPPLPQHHYQARRGITTYFFRFPVPLTSPPTINFGTGLAKVRYEIRASIGVVWKGERRIVTDRIDAQVVEGVDSEAEQPCEGVVVAENGKIWAQGRLVGGVAIAGQSACVELQVKNHTSKKTTGLSLSVMRSLHLPNTPANQKNPLHITDTLTSVNFKGPEYVVPSGVEGMASLVFDVPKDARGVRGGLLEGDEESGKQTESIFKINCSVSIKIGMGIGSKDIFLEIPINIYHPLAMPTPPEPPQEPYLGYSTPPMQPAPTGPYGIPLPSSPAPQFSYPYAGSPPPMFPEPARAWSPLPFAPTPQPYQYFNVPAVTGDAYYFPPPPMQPSFARSLSIRRSVSTGPPRGMLPNFMGLPHPSGLPVRGSNPLGPVPPPSSVAFPAMGGAPTAALPMPPSRVIQEDQSRGVRARRVSNHLRMTSRNRSVSPHTRTLANAAAETIPEHDAFPALDLATAAPPAAAPQVSQAALRVATAALPLEAPETNLSPGTTPMTPRMGPPVVSPRPSLSPKQSFHNERRRSADVVELERMADEVSMLMKDLSGDLPKTDESSAPAVTQVLELEKDKTLPAPPVPSGRDRLTSAVAATRPRANELFVPTNTGVQFDQETPATPTLTAVPIGAMRRSRVHLSVLGGLDALEAKLLAEVGTRKPQKNDRPPDVRSILPMPIAIPTPGVVPVEPADDSAISSLSLAAEQQNLPLPDNKTIKSGSGSEKDGGEDVDGGYTTSREKEKRKERGRTRTMSKEGDELRRMRKEARGRVAAWLGSVEPVTPPSQVDSPASRILELSPLVGSPIVSPREISPGRTPPRQTSPNRASLELASPVAASPRATSPASRSLRAVSPSLIVRDRVSSIPKPEPEVTSPSVDASKEIAMRAIGKAVVKEATPLTPKSEIVEVASVPNPRSSGFVPIGTTRATMLQKAAEEQVEENIKVATIKKIPVERRAANIAKLWEEQHPAGVFSESTAASPTTSKAKVAPSTQKPAPSKPPVNSNVNRTPSRKIQEPFARLSLSPPKPLSDDGPTYDVRSARGGRGGKVTSVAAIWAQKTGTERASSGNGKGASVPPNKNNVQKRTSLPAPSRPSPWAKSSSPVSASPLRAIRETDNASSSPPSSSPVRSPSVQNVADLTARRAAKIKSPSVPAAISNSLATPMLSSTASLARPLVSSPYPPKPSAANITVSASDIAAPVTSNGSSSKHLITDLPPNGKPEMIFGQAKLKDLIKKYQGLSS